MSTKTNRQQWYLNLARGQKCTVRLPDCDVRGTVVAAHIHLQGQGIMGSKAPDSQTCWACAHCHAIIDGAIPRPEGWTKQDVDCYAYQAVLETQHKAVKLMNEAQKAKLWQVFA